jgi:hypothetical protein
VRNSIPKVARLWFFTLLLEILFATLLFGAIGIGPVAALVRRAAGPGPDTIEVMPHSPNAMSVHSGEPSPARSSTLPEIGELAHRAVHTPLAWFALLLMLSAFGRAVLATVRSPQGAAGPALIG